MAMSEKTVRVLNYLKEKYPYTYADNLYKIILVGSIDDGVRLSLAEITTRLNDSVYFAKLRDKTEIKLDYETLSKENTLKGVFVKNMLTKIESAEENEKEQLLYALNIGIKAFSGEVHYDET